MSFIILSVIGLANFFIATRRAQNVKAVIQLVLIGIIGIGLLVVVMYFIATLLPFPLL